MSKKAKNENNSGPEVCSLNAEQLREIQMKGLEILLYFKKFCEENNLLFYLCGGCCIGSLRHNGFIPWDDDIDVFMPRDDYEKLQALWAEKADSQQYAYVKFNKNHYTRFTLAAISDENTAFIKQRQHDLDTNHGFRLEILPLDGCPNGRFKRKMQIIWALLFTMFIVNEPPTSKGKLFEILGRIALFLTPTYWLKYKIARLAEKRMTRFPIKKCDKITELYARYQYMTNEYPKEIFESAVYKNFEGHEVPIPVGYDTYLKMAFGDYMKLPPEESRIPKHDIVFYDLNNSYKKYKGKYYCLDK